MTFKRRPTDMPGGVFLFLMGNEGNTFSNARID
jgi:hypothetical protein